MRLIDADALLEKLIKTPRYFDLKFDIDNAPTIDAEPGVRCKDCRCRRTDECPMYWEEWNVREDGVELLNVHDYTRDNGFCDWGERSEP